jgi:hypothetical protein
VRGAISIRTNIGRAREAGRLLPSFEGSLDAHPSEGCPEAGGEETKSVANESAAPFRRRLAVFLLVLGTAVIAPAANAACPDRPLAREFERWLDPIKYTIVPGGHFENGARGWTLSGGARIVGGNEPFHLRAAADDQSLHLPSGSSATSPFVCVELLDPVARFVTRNRGSASGTLRVDAIVRTGGRQAVLPAGVAALPSGWQPSLPMLTASNFLAGLNLESGTAQVAFRFRPTGLLSAWQIDDVYVDPFRSR